MRGIAERNSEVSGPAGRELREPNRSEGMGMGRMQGTFVRRVRLRVRARARVEYLLVSRLPCGLRIGQLLLEARALERQTLQQAVLLLELLARLAEHSRVLGLHAGRRERLQARLRRRRKRRGDGALGGRHVWRRLRLREQRREHLACRRLPLRSRAFSAGSRYRYRARRELAAELEHFLLQSGVLHAQLLEHGQRRLGLVASRALTLVHH